MKITNVENAGLKGSMMKGSTQTVYFNDSYDRLSIYTMKGMVKMEIVNDKTANSTLMLTGGMMLGKKKVKVNTEEKKLRTYNISYDNSDSKTILGYTCTKATLENDKIKMEVYYTDKINVHQTPLRKQFSGLQGFPLQYTIIDDEGVRITYTAQHITPDPRPPISTYPPKATKKWPNKKLKKCFGMRVSWRFIVHGS